MTPDLGRRCEFFLFVALALALAGGVMAMPAMDPLDALAPMSPLNGWLAGALHALLGAWSAEMVRLCLARRIHPAWRLPAIVWTVRGLLLAAWGWWWLSRVGASSGGDARALLWWQLLPLLLWPAGLLSVRSATGWFTASRHGA